MVHFPYMKCTIERISAILRKNGVCNVFITIKGIEQSVRVIKSKVEDEDEGV